MNRKGLFAVLLLGALVFAGGAGAVPGGVSAPVTQTKTLIVSNKSGLTGGSAAGAASVLSGTGLATYRFHSFTSGAVNPGWRVVYDCAYIIATAAAGPCPSNLTLHATWYSPQAGAQTFPITFKGNSGWTDFGVGSQIVSDPIGEGLPANADIWFCTAVSGASWPVGRSPANQNATGGEGDNVGTNTNDLTGNCSVRTNMVAANALVVPAAIIGVPVSKTQGAVGFNGDNRLSGTGANTNANPNTGYVSYAELGAAAAIPWATSTRASDALAYYLTQTQYRVRDFLVPSTSLPAITTFDNSLGINDVTAGTSLATMKTELTAIWTLWANMGVNVCQDTLYPNTTSSDYFATVSGQTPAASETTRVAVNDWIRTLPPPLNCVNDVASAIEVNSSGVPTVDGGRYSVVNVISTTGNTHSNTTLDGIAVSASGWIVGDAICGPDFSAYTFITAVVSSSQVTLNQVATGTHTGTTVVYNCPSTDGLHASSDANATMATVISAAISSGKIH